jgi:hypothetical protein
MRTEDVEFILLRDDATLDCAAQFGDKITWFEGHDPWNEPKQNGSMWGMDVSHYGMGDSSSGTAEQQDKLYVFSTHDDQYKVYQIELEDAERCTSVAECITYATDVFDYLIPQ